MSVHRLLNFPAVLISVTDTGTEDDWGSPITEESRTDVKCYYRQTETGDPDDEGGSVMWESLDIFLDMKVPVLYYDAIEIDVGMGVERFEVIGQPVPELNARTGIPNHLKIQVRRGSP